MRESLGLSQVHILGQSWGGMLAIEYMLTRPLGVVSLILSNTASSVPLWVAEANRLRAALPVDVNAKLLEHEHAGTHVQSRVRGGDDDLLTTGMSAG